MYGHTLPVNDFDISYDSSLIITGSADKTVRIWGLDYGDCHRRLTTDSSMTSIKFIPHTHQFFTSDKNGYIKHWDADVFERVLTLQVPDFKNFFLNIFLLFVIIMMDISFFRATEVNVVI